MADDRATMLADIAAVADELTDVRKHREPFEVWSPSRHRVKRWHETTVPGLLAQLRAAFVPGRAEQVESGSGVPGSRPPLHLEAISRHTVITVGAARWMWSLELTQRETVEANVRALVGAAGAMDSDAQAALLTELRRWRTWCAVLTGWETPPFRPHVACPVCDTMDSLVIRLDTSKAYCRDMDCLSTWDASSIGVLGEYIRRKTEGKGAVAARSVVPAS